MDAKDAVGGVEGFDDLEDVEGELVKGEDGMMYREIEVREQDRFLPVANIARIMKKVLPSNAKIAKDGKETIQNCVSEFISFITSEASEKCQQEKRKTINGDDILWAMSTLGMEKYIEPLRMYLGKYRESVKGEKPEKKTTSSKRDAGMMMSPSMGGSFKKQSYVGDGSDGTDLGYGHQDSSYGQGYSHSGGIFGSGQPGGMDHHGQHGAPPSNIPTSAPVYQPPPNRVASIFGQQQNAPHVPGTIFEGPTPGTHQVLREDGTYATVRYVNPDGTPFTGDLSQVITTTHQPFTGAHALPGSQSSSMSPAPGATTSADFEGDAAAAEAEAK